MIEQYQGGTKVTLFRCTKCGQKFTRNHTAPYGAKGAREVALAYEQTDRSIAEITAEHRCPKEAR